MRGSWNLLVGGCENVLRFAGQTFRRKHTSNFSTACIKLSYNMGEGSTIVKSKSDDKDYRLIKLDNGLRALLISDLKDEDPETTGDNSQSKIQQDVAEEQHGNPPRAQNYARASSDAESSDLDESDTTESEGEDDDDDCISSEEEEENQRAKKDKNATKKKQAAASLCISVGSFADPDNVPGLAHFLEHMVFMGSEKYPDENKFDAFIRLHGGNDNAFTDCERTVFQFEIQPQQFKDALDIWAQFFISPLLKQDSVDREVKAVDSEFDMALNSDYCRKEQLFATLFPNSHPMGKFMWGNKLSLLENPAKEGVAVYDALKNFHKKYYSSHFMTLAVQSPEELDVLESWVREIFSIIPCNSETVPAYVLATTDQAPFKIYKIAPVRNIQELQMMWAVPPQQKFYRTKPLHYVSWLMGHEGKGSILSLLKKENLALDLASGCQETGFEQNQTCSVFSVTITLTDKGYSLCCDVIDVVFQYLAMLRKEGANERVFREIQKIEDIDFMFKEGEPPIENVIKQCVNVLLYPEEDILTGDELLYEYAPECIEQAMSAFKPDKCVVFLSSPEHKNLLNPQKEKWFGTPYACEDIADSWKTKWVKADSEMDISPSLHLPAPNNFIAENFEIKPTCDNKSQVQSKYPALLSDSNAGYKLWFKQDDHFKLPKAYIHVNLVNPLSNRTPQDSVCVELLVKLLTHNLAEVTYDADAASLSYNAKIDGDGELVLKFSGYNDKLPALVDAVTEHLASFKTTREDFDQQLLQHMRTYYNELIKPKKFANNLRLSIIEKNKWSSLDKYAACRGLKFEGFLSFVKEFLSSLYIEGLIQGNYTASEAETIMANFVKKLGCSMLDKTWIVPKRVLRLGESEKICKAKALNPVDDNSMVTTYYQVGPTDTNQSAMMRLLEAVMDEPCFNTLRTIKQLGYSVYVQQHNTAGILGLSVNVGTQNSKFSVETTASDIAEFVTVEMDDIITKMEQSSFDSQVASVIAVLKNEDTHLGEEVDRNWHEILSGDYVFDKIEREVKFLESCTKENLKEFYKSVCVDNKKILHIQVKGNSPAPSAGDPGVAPGDPAQQTQKMEGLQPVDEDASTPPPLLLTLLEHEGETPKNTAAVYVTSIEMLKQFSSFYPVAHVEAK